MVANAEFLRGSINMDGVASKKKVIGDIVRPVSVGFRLVMQGSKVVPKVAHIHHIQKYEFVKK
jgi:hypothetical protein